MRFLLLVVLLTCVIEYQQFVDANSCSNGGSNCGNCNNKSSCNKSKCKTSCSNCGERCAKINCNTCKSSNTGCNERQSCSQKTTHNCPTTVRPTVSPLFATTKVTPVTRTPTTDEVNINIQLSNKIETKNNVNVPIDISLVNKNIVVNLRNESTSGGEKCTRKPPPTHPDDDNDIETLTHSPETSSVPPIEPRSSDMTLIPRTSCLQQRSCPLSHNQLCGTNCNPWANYISQFPQGYMGSPYYAQLYGNQHLNRQYNLQGLPGHSYTGL